MVVGVGLGGQCGKMSRCTDARSLGKVFKGIVMSFSIYLTLSVFPPPPYAYNSESRSLNLTKNILMII